MADPIRPSRADKPDLDWSQVRETVMMLHVAASNIERTMKDGDESVTVLADLFTSMMGNVQAIAKAAENLDDSPEKTTITQNHATVSEKMNAAIVAFQFYDLLTQRLTHVCNSLASLAELIIDPRRLYNPYEWFGLQEKIKSKYTVPADRAMFDAILNGATVEEALEISLHHPEADDDEENVELF